MQDSKFSSMTLKKIENVQQQGWDAAALAIYIKKRKVNALEADQAIFLIGSELYTEMFDQSQLSAHVKVMLVINHLGGYQDELGDLQFTASEYNFCDQMSPGAPFLDSYAKAVQCAYPNGLFIASTDKKLSKIALKKKYAKETKIHQFRNQLDKSNVQYVENYKVRHGLKNDETAIKMILGNNWLYADPQYHNRAHLGSDIMIDDLTKGRRSLAKKGLIKKIRNHGFYRKILSADYHSEFIVDEQGRLLSQWTKQIKSKAQLESAIVNGESFNYGERPRLDQYQTHDKLDGKPPRYFDTTKRNELKQDWLSPIDDWFYQLVRRLSEKGLKYQKRTRNKR